MMRTVLYIVLLGALFFVPLKRTEIANLEPIQAVWMYEDGVEIILETDTEDRGVGKTVREALDDMKQEMIAIATLMAQKVVTASIDTKVQERLIEETLKEMGEQTWQS